MAMSIKTILDIGSRVLITCPDRDDTDTYVSRLEDFRPDGIAIAVPLRRGYPLLIRDGERIRLRVPADEAYIEFESRVIRRTESMIRLYLIEYPETWRRVQLRANVRLEETIRVEGYSETTGEEICFDTHDLSAGGLGLRSSKKIDIGTRFWVSFRIAQKKAARRIEARGEVVRVMRADGPHGNEYRIGLKFVEIKKADQDFIVGFIFQRMSEQKRRS